MANNIEYIFSLRDRISVKLAGITATSDKTVAALSGVQEKVRTAEDVFRDTGKTIGSLKAKIDALQAEKEWIPADNIPVVKEYNREISKLTDELERLETAAGGGKFKKWASEAFDAIPGANLLKNPLVTGITAIGAAGMSGMNFDESMATVNITAQLDESGLDDLKKRLRQIAADNKADVQVTPVGFEAINSQVNDVELSLQILDAALKGSKAGFTDLDTVSAALAQTLSIVGKENTTAQEVLDTFFAAKRVGAGEFADFARYMPNLIAGADNLGIAYKEVAGTFAYMTGKGQSAERAATLMENAFSVLGRVDVRKKLSAAGVDVFDDAGKIRGMVDIFTDLKEVLGGMTDEQKSSMLEQFGLVDKEAKSAFSVLMSDTAKLRESMDDVANSTGETTTALGYSRNAVQQAAELWNRFKNIGTQVGEIMLPVISAGLTVAGVVLSGVSAVMDTVIGFFGGWFSLLEQGNPVVVGLTSTLGILTAAMALNYAWTQRTVVIGGIKKVLDIAQTAVTGGLTAAQTALNAAFMASPLGWIATGIGVVIGVVTACWQKFEGFRVAVLGTWGVIKEFGRTLLDSIVKPFKQVLSGIGGVCSAIVSLLKGNFKEAATLAKDGFKEIGEGVLGANPVSVAYNTIRNGNYARAWEKGKQAGRDSWAASRQETDTMTANQLMPDVPEIQKVKTPDYDSLMRKVQAVGGKGKHKRDTIRLDDNKANLNETAEYTAVTRKLEPVVIPQFPQVPAASEKVVPMNPSGISSSPVADDRTQSYEGGEETNYLADIMMNVRKIAAAVLVPLTIAASPLNDVQAKETAPIDLTVPEVAAPLVNVPAPSVNVPDIAVPALTVPETPVPSVSVNDTVNVPDVNVPQVQIPEAAAPLVNVPSPSVNVPDIAVPTLTVPETPVPSVSVNDTVNVPDVNVPQVQIPEAAAPLVNVPSPSVNVPDIAVPALTVPEIPVPSVSVNGTVNVPDVSVPQVQVPEVATPMVNVPSPSVNVPDIAVPTLTVPETPVPSVSVNDTVNVPDVNVPQVQIPEAAAPLVNVPSPSVNVPDIAVPTSEMPEIPAPSVAVNDTVNVPDVNVPQVQVPEAAAPLVNVPAPSVNVPDIAVPTLTVPEIPAPSVAVNDTVNVPDVNVPQVQVPEAAAPLVNVPAPSVNVPDIAVPTLTVPETPVPSVSVNDTVNVPDVNVPQVQVPEAAAPLVNVPSPSVNVPDIAVPALTVPETPVPSVSVNDTVNVPDVNVPQVQIPEAAAPLVNVPAPSVNVPDIAVPALNIPEIPSPDISDAYNVENIRETNNTFTADNSRTYNSSGRSVQIGKVCDEVVIHVANTDEKGADTIRHEIMRILEELGE